MKKFKFLASFLLAAALATAVPLKSVAVVTNQTVDTTTALGNGSTVNFTISFDFRDNSQVAVDLIDTLASTTTRIAQGAGASKFTVTGGNPGTTVHMGTAPTTTQYLHITRVIPITQPVVFDNAAPFPATDFGNQFDLLTLELQNVAAGASTLTGSSGGGGSGSFPATAIADNFVGYNHAGTSVITIPGSTVTLLSGDILKYNGSGWGRQAFSGAGILGLINAETATPVVPGAGGTGVSNSGLLTWGSHALTFNLSADTSVTLPASGTLLAGTAATGNTANTFVKRDGSGNFSAGTVTADTVGTHTGGVVGNVTGNTSGTSANVTGVIAIGHGGTGQTTAQTALDALFGTQTNNYVCRSDGTHTALGQMLSGDLPTIPRTKIAASTANTIVSNDGSGNLSVIAGSSAGDVLGFNGLSWSSTSLASLPKEGTQFLFDQIATPANPAATKDSLYAKSDDLLYWLNSAGSEKRVNRMTDATGILPAANGGLGFDASSSTGFLQVSGGVPAASALTAGQIVFPGATGLPSGDSSLFWDNTNKSLGIATNAPAYDFEHKSAQGARNYFAWSNATGTSKLLHYVDNNTISFWKFAGNSFNNMVLNPSGVNTFSGNLTSQGSASVGDIVNGKFISYAAQTSDFTQWINSLGTTVAKVRVDGKVFGNGLDAGSSTISSVSSPVASSDAATKGWVDSTLASSTLGMTALGDTLYGGAAGARTTLAGNTTTTRKFKMQQGTGAASAAPSWSTIDGSDLPDPAPATKGGMRSFAAQSNKWINSLGTNGLATATQPAFTDITGTLAVTAGGTGQTSFTNGQLLIGNTATGGLTSSTLTAGSGITITNGNGLITLAATAAAAQTDPGELRNVAFSSTVSSSTMVVTLTQGDGSTAPSAGTAAANIGFRSATATNGGYTETSFTATSTVTLGTTDSIGFTTNVAAPMYVYAVSDTLSEICVSGLKYDDKVLQSASAMTAGADTTLAAIWCNSAHTSKPIRFLGEFTAKWATGLGWQSGNALKTGVTSTPFVYTPWKNDLTWTYTGMGTVSANNVWYRRIGDTMEVRGSVAFGTPSAATCSINLPTGYTIDSSKFSTDVSVQGIGVANETYNATQGVWAVDVGLIPFYDGSTTASVFIAEKTGAQVFTKVNCSTFLNAGSSMSFNFSIPISQWGP